MRLKSTIFRGVIYLGVTFAVLAGQTRAEPSRVAYLGGDALHLIEERSLRIADALAKLGHVKGVDFVITAQSFGGNLKALPDIAGLVVRGKPDIIYAGSWDVAAAMKRQTSTIPIVFAARANLESPVFRIVDDLQRPEANVTGFTRYVNLVPKKMQLLKEAFPALPSLGLIYGVTMFPSRAAEYQQVGNRLGVRVYFCKFRSDEVSVLAQELNGVAARCTNDDKLPPCDTTDCNAVSPRGQKFARSEIGGFIPLIDDLMVKNRTEFTAQMSLVQRPLVFPEPATSSGVMSHYVPVLDGEAKAAEYISKLLRGAKIRDLAVQEPQEFDFSVNVTTLRRLGLTMSRDVLARARKVE